MKIHEEGMASIPEWKQPSGVPYSWTLRQRTEIAKHLACTKSIENLRLRQNTNKIQIRSAEEYKLLNLKAWKWIYTKAIEIIMW